MSLVYKDLGKDVQGTLTWKEAIKKADLDWETSKEPLYDCDGNKVPHFGIFRKDTRQCLGAVGSNYTPVQNHETFSFLDSLTGAGMGLEYSTAGAIDGGKRIWTLVKLPHRITVGSSEQLMPYLLAVNSNDGSSRLTFKLTTVRPVCSNTLNFSLKEKAQTLALRHTTKVKARMDDAQKVLATIGDKIDNIGLLLNRLSKTQLSGNKMKEFLEATFDLSKESEQIKAAEILSIFEHNDGDVYKEQRGTAFNMLSAVTNFVDHRTSPRPKLDETEAQARARGAMFGVGEAFKFAALNNLVQVVFNINSMELT